MVDVCNGVACAAWMDSAERVLIARRRRVPRGPREQRAKVARPRREAAAVGRHRRRRAKRQQDVGLGRRVLCSGTQARQHRCRRDHRPGGTKRLSHPRTALLRLQSQEACRCPAAARACVARPIVTGVPRRDGTARAHSVRRHCNPPALRSQSVGSHAVRRRSTPATWQRAQTVASRRPRRAQSRRAAPTTPRAVASRRPYPVLSRRADHTLCRVSDRHARRTARDNSGAVPREANPALSLRGDRVRARSPCVPLDWRFRGRVCCVRVRGDRTV